MRCENYGAEYRMKDVSCPFCQSENPVLAEIRRDDIFRDACDEARTREETETIGGKLIENAGYTLQLCRQYSRDNIFYGDEALFEEYYEEVRRELLAMGISDAQLEWMSVKRENMKEDSVFQQIVDLVVETYMGYYYPAGGKAPEDAEQSGLEKHGGNYDIHVL